MKEMTNDNVKKRETKWNDDEMVINENGGKPIVLMTNDDNNESNENEANGQARRKSMTSQKMMGKSINDINQWWNTVIDKW